MSAAIAMRPRSMPMSCRAGADELHLRHLNAARQASMSTASGQLHVQFDEILNEIDSFRNLRYGWDGDEGHPISADSIAVAKRFLVSAMCLIFEQQLLTWRSPIPCADPDGGVELYWDDSNRWLELLFQPGEPARILAVKGDSKVAPIKRETSSEDAMSLVWWVLGA